MNIITTEYLLRAETWLLITTLLYFLMNGAGIYETAVIIPKWTASPPESFQLFKGKYGLNLKRFWIIMHCIHEITFIIAIIFCWNLDFFRNWLIILFTVHFLVRVWTIIYFAREIIEFQKIANSQGTQYADLPKRTRRWRNLNYLRTGLFIAISVILVFLLIKLTHLS